MKGPRHLRPGHPDEPTPTQAVRDLEVMLARVRFLRRQAETEKRRRILTRALADLAHSAPSPLLT